MEGKEYGEDIVTKEDVDQMTDTDYRLKKRLTYILTKVDTVSHGIVTKICSYRVTGYTTTVTFDGGHGYLHETEIPTELIWSPNDMVEEYAEEKRRKEEEVIREAAERHRQEKVRQYERLKMDLGL